MEKKCDYTLVEHHPVPRVRACISSKLPFHFGWLKDQEHYGEDTWDGGYDYDDDGYGDDDDDEDDNTNML